MDLDLAGKVVVVTGASKGIGHACAEAFLRQGAKVALVSRSHANLERRSHDCGRARRRFRSARISRMPTKRRGWSRTSKARWGEIAKVALFLASERASYVTGAIVPMDRGAGAVI